jgi:hypothetical protein
MATQPRSAASFPSGPANPADHWAPWLRDWDTFWFKPADPTVLGLIRLCCGLVVLHVHLVYTFDLYELCGKDAWLNLAEINAQRKEGPIVAPPLDWGEQQRPKPKAKNSFEQQYITVYKQRWGVWPPEPLPKDEKEARAIEEYMATWAGDPNLATSKGSRICSLWFHLTDPTWMAVAHGVILVIMLLFTIGFCTRITSVLTWLAALSYIQRAQTTLFGMDTMMNILLVYLMIGPSGAALSVDRLISRWWALRKARLANRPAPPWEVPRPSATANFVTRLLQIHFCIIYMASGLSKLQGGAWWNGTALWGTLANPEFAPMNFALYEDMLRWLAQHRFLWELVTSGGVVFTLVMEIGLPFMIWMPKLRWVMIIGSVMLHTGIALTMGLTTFGLFMLCMLLAFIPSETVRWFLQSLRGPVQGALQKGQDALRERVPEKVRA